MKHMVAQNQENSQEPVKRFRSCGLAGACAVLLMSVMGCNGLPANTPVSGGGPQTYMAPLVSGTAVNPSPFFSDQAPLLTYTIDDTTDKFSQTSTNLVTQQGTIVNNAGAFTVLQRGLRSLGTTYALPYTASATAITYPLSPLVGSYAVELAGQAGGLIQMIGQPATPLVATSNCPSIATAQTFQFITLPQASFISSNQTAFGSVSIATNGTTVNFSNIQQFTLPVNGGSPGTPSSAYASTATGACSPTPYGNTISIPVDVVTNPNGGALQGEGPVILGIGQTGLLVESLADGGYPNNVLGAGTGAIGLPQPSSSLGTTPMALAGTSQPQYLGFIYSGGAVVSGAATVWTSNIASFGFPSSLQSSCAAFAAQTGTLVNGIYGGDFPVNATSGLPDPSQASVQTNGGYGNCNLAVDLGTESSTSNGLYPAAKVWIGSQFTANTTSPKKTYSFPAVAVAGQLQGKFVILLIGEDTTSSPHQPWSIYLMQSN